MALIAVLVRLLPVRAAAAFGCFVGWLVGSVLRIRRRHVEAAMARAGVVSPRAAAGAMYRGLGLGAVELLRGGVATKVVISAEAERALDVALARGPVILLASHTANWELAAAAAARLLEARGRKLAVVAKAIRARGVDRWIARLRASLGVHVIDPVGALRSAHRALAEGVVVAMPIDQVPEHGSSLPRCAFLGAPALVDRAPATLAWRARATLVVVASRRDGDVQRVDVLRVVAPTTNGTAREWIAAASADATRALDRFVVRHPEAWLWLHRRWRAPLVASVQAG